MIITKVFLFLLIHIYNDFDHIHDDFDHIYDNLNDICDNCEHIYNDLYNINVIVDGKVCMDVSLLLMNGDLPKIFLYYFLVQLGLDHVIINFNNSIFMYLLLFIFF